MLKRTKVRVKMETNDNGGRLVVIKTNDSNFI